MLKRSKAFTSYLRANARLLLMDLVLVRMSSNSRKASHILLNHKEMFQIESEEGSLTVKKDKHVIYHSNLNIWGNERELV